jgi:hypothetical protein
VRGTDHPENYPPGVRQLMSGLPMWSALTDKASMRQAGRWAKPARPSRQRTTGPSRRGPRGNELLNAVIGWSLVNIALVAA